MTATAAHFANAQLPDLGEDMTFRLFALHSNRFVTYPLELVERVTWDDSSAITTGSITLRVPPGEAPSPELRLDQGDRILLEANRGHGWQPVWVMRCYQPEATASNAQRTFQLVNDLDLLRRSEDNFLFNRDRGHPHGWTGPEVIRYVATHYQVLLGSIYQDRGQSVGKIRVRRGSPLAAIRNVLLREKRRNGRRLFVRWDVDKTGRGYLSVVPLQRSPVLRGLGPTLMEAAFRSELREQFGSAVTLHSLPELISGAQNAQGRVAGKIQKGHVYASSPQSISLFGYVHRIEFSPDARTDSLLAQEATAWLAAVTAPYKTLTLTQRGNPWLRRGDAIQVAIGDAGLKRQVVWVNQVQHTLTDTSYSMDVSVIFDDPYRHITQEKVFNRLKSTHDEAVGNRARTNPLWNFPPNNKSDLATTASQDPYTLTPATDPGGLNSGAGPYGLGG